MDTRAENEYEIKFVGPKESLTTVFNKFVEMFPSVRDRHYSFNTYYFDTPSWNLYRQGYSVRHRTGSPEAELEGGTEIKATHGSTQSGISKRFETQVKGLDFHKNYLRLLSLESLPKDFPTNFTSLDLSLKFTSAVKRHERQVKLDSFGVTVEVALDDLTYLSPCEKAPRRLRPSSVFDVLQRPRHDMYELEFELKRGSLKNFESFKILLERMCVKGTPKVYPSVESKATRGRYLCR